MDLEEMKNTWEQMSAELESQKKLTNELILQMAHQKSSRSISNLQRFETLAGLLVGVPLIVGTGYHLAIGTFESIPLIICAILSLALFLGSLALNMVFIFRTSKINLLENTLVESQEYFKKLQDIFRFHKQFGIYTTIPTVLFYVPVVLKVFKDKDIFLDFSGGQSDLVSTLISSGLIGIPVIYFVFRFYSQNMKATAEAHKDIEKM